MKSLKHYLVVVAISFLPFVSIFATSQMPHTHDGPVHLARMAEYYKAIQDGQIIPRWAGNLNYGYGTPIFLFTYHAPYILGSLFLAMGFGLVTSFKLILLTCFIFSGIFMFAFTKSFFKDSQKALVITLFYQFAPYHLVDLVVRGSIGDSFVYTFLPLLLYSLVQLMKTVNFPNLILIVISVALLLLSHNTVSLALFGVSFLFLLYFSNNGKTRAWGTAAMVVGVSLVAYYWIPILFEHRFTYGDFFTKNMYTSHFAPLAQFLLPNFTNNEGLQTGGVAMQWGIFHIIAIILSLIAIKNLTLSIFEKKIIYFSLFLTILPLFFMQPISKFFWEHLSLLRQFQFPWRLLTVVNFTTALLSFSYFFFSKLISKKILTAITLCMIISTIVYWNPPLGFDKINENYYWNYPLNTTYFGEIDIIWGAGPAKSYPKNRVEVAEGTATITNLIKHMNRLTLDVTAASATKLAAHIAYFPGWRVYVDGVKTLVQFQDPNYRGLLLFSIPAGQHKVKIVFEESPTRVVGDIITLATLVVLCGLGFFMRKRL